jgi:hypothetical protein
MWILLETVNKTYGLVSQLNAIPNAENRRLTEKLMFQQTTECALFMRDYIPREQGEMNMTEHVSLFWGP